MTTIAPRGPFTIDGAGVSSEDLLGPEWKNLGHILLTTPTPRVVNGVRLGSKAYVINKALYLQYGSMEGFLRYLLVCSSHENFDLKAHVPRIKRILGDECPSDQANPGRRMTREQMIQAMLAQVEDWDLDNLIDYVQDQMRQLLENADIESVQRDYEQSCVDPTSG
jgi:hypothetical protein